VRRGPDLGGVASFRYLITLWGRENAHGWATDMGMPWDGCTRRFGRSGAEKGIYLVGMIPATQPLSLHAIFATYAACSGAFGTNSLLLCFSTFIFNTLPLQCDAPYAHARGV
jgi:hypothetical protein